MPKRHILLMTTIHFFILTAAKIETVEGFQVNFSSKYFVEGGSHEDIIVVTCYNY